VDKIVEGKNHKGQPDWATHPGEHLAEYIETNKWSQAEFARLAGMTPKLVSTIISGDNPVTAETALKLERVLGVRASFWTNLQANWDLHQAKASEKIGAKEAKTWLEMFPMKELAERGVCKDRDDVTSCVNDLLRLIGIGSPGSCFDLVDAGRTEGPVNGFAPIQRG
jgi:HTH-type transcriptional regulator/antitoxin HigA